MEHFLHTSLVFVCYTTVLPRTMSFLKSLFLFGLIFSFTFILTPLGQISSFVVLFFICLSIAFLAKPRLLSVCCSIWGYSCGIIVNYSCLVMAECLFSLTLADLSNRYFVEFTLLNIVLDYAILRIFQYIIRKKLQIISVKLSLPLLWSCLLCLLTCCIIFICNFTYSEMLGYPTAMVRINAFLFTIFFILVVLLLFFIIREFGQKQEYQRRLEYLSLAQEYSANLESSYQEIRKFKHDYHNIILSISGYLEKEDILGIKKYFSTSLEPLYQQLNTFSNDAILDRLKIPEVKGLCLNKAITARSFGITVRFSVPALIQDLTMDVLDFIRILGIYFDNAIDAAKNSKEKNLEVMFIKEEAGNTLLLSNSCDDKLTLYQLSGGGYSSKGKEHGNGLRIAKEILKCYPAIEHNTYIKDSYVIQELRNL